MNPLEILEPSSTGMVFFHLKLQPVILFLIQVSTHWHGHVHRDHDVSCKGHKLLDPKWPQKHHTLDISIVTQNWGERYDGMTATPQKLCGNNTVHPVKFIQPRLIETWIGSSTSLQKSMNGRKTFTSKLQLDVEASEVSICDQWKDEPRI